MDAAEICERLSGSLPAVTLLLGPGGWEAGQALWQAHGTPYGLVTGWLGAGEAREIRDLAWVLPPEGFRLFLIRLDRASAQAQHILLKTLEEPPPCTRFVLTASRPPLDTVISRCQVFPAGAGETPAEDDGKARSAVGVAVRAALAGHQPVLEAVLRTWEPEHARVLCAWAAEAAAGHWRAFDESFAPGATARQALAVLAALSGFEGARTAGAVALARAFRSPD